MPAIPDCISIPWCMFDRPSRIEMIFSEVLTEDSLWIECIGGPSRRVVVRQLVSEFMHL